MSELKHILAFGFVDTVAEQVVKALNEPVDRVYIKSEHAALEKFINNTQFEKYDYVIGLGSYSGRDKYELRIETVCTSQFRADKTSFKVLPIPYFLQPKAGFKLAKGIGNSWCNLVSYKIVAAAPRAKYTFLHVPKTFLPTQAAALLDSQLLLL